jgi:hypothetical protein
MTYARGARPSLASLLFVLGIAACGSGGSSADAARPPGSGGTGGGAVDAAAGGTGGGGGMAAGGAGGGGGAAAGRDGGAGGMAGAAGGSSGAGGAPSGKSGNITVSNIVVGPTAIYTATATFRSTAEESPGCTNRTVNGCQVIRCQTSDGGAMMPAGTAPHVGAISITGGAMPVTLTPGADGQYAAARGMGSFWTGAARITFSAAGGPIPAFPSTQVDAPQPIMDTKLNGAAPATAPMRTTVSRAAGMRLTWTGGTGTIGFILGQQMGANILSMVCETPAMGGSYTVPAAVVNELMPGNGTLSISLVSVKTVMAGDYPTVLGLGTNPNPSLFALTVE